MWTIGGVTYEWSSDWFQGWAAMLQAVLTAGAVYGAAWLQDRGIAKREAAARAVQLEGVAATVRYANSVVEKLSAVIDKARPVSILAMNYSARLTSPVRALAAAEPARLGDIPLTEFYLTFEQLVRDVQDRFAKAEAKASRSSSSLDQIPMGAALGQLPTEVFNAAAAVERHIASLNRRRPLL